VANETFLDASGATKYRKSTGAGSAGDPAVAHNIIDGTVTVTGAGGTFPVTGTVTANIGTIAGLATETTLQSATGFLTSIDASLDSITRAEDAIHTSGNRGVVSLAVRRDTLAGTASDGDYITLSTDATGRLYTTSTVTGSVAVTGTFWQATQPVSIASTLTVTGTGGTFPVTDSGGTLTVDAPVGTPVFVRLSDGTNAIATLPVSLASVPSHPVTNAGTFVVQENGGALTALQLIDNLVLAEDAAHVTGDAGIQSLAVRNDSDTSLAGTTGDYTPLQVDSNGYLKVNIKAGAGSGGTASTDDAAFTAGSGSGTPMMGFVTSDTVDSGDVGVIGMLANRQVKVTLYDSAGAELAVGGGTQYDEDTAHVSGDKLTMAGAVRRDVATSGVSADGDRATLNVDSNGRLYTVCSVLSLTGAAAQTAIVNNILSDPSGSDGTSATNFRSASVQVVSTGTAGTFIFEQSNNGTNWVALPVFNAALTTGVPITAAITATASAIVYRFPTVCSQIRLRIATTITGGSIQAFTRLSAEAYTPAVYTVAQPTAASLAVSASGTVTANLGTGGTAATSLGKAEDAVHASGDTGVAVWAVRRNTATSGTSADGDYASLNVDTNGLLWTNVGAALPAGTNLIGQIVTRPDVSNASDGSTVLVPKFARLSTASTGNQAIVAAVSGKKIRVLSMNVMATASTNAVWINDGTADLHGTTSYKIPLDVTGATGAGGFVLPFNQLGWFETAANNRPININLGSANGITAIVTYVEV
jgi:hypothetical protein